MISRASYLLGSKNASIFRVNRCITPIRVKYSTQVQNPSEGLIITSKCAETVKRLTAEDWVKNKELAKLRVMVKGGGCSGFQYSFSLDDQGLEDDDILLNKDDAKIVVDKESYKHLLGATLDWKEQLIRSSFVISNNPNSEQTCGCGTSFSSKVKD